MADYEILIQKPANKPIGFVRGNSYSLTFTFPFNLTDYTIESAIKNGSTLYAFTIIPGAYSASSSVVSIYISEELSETIDNADCTWYFNLKKTTVKRTWFSGTCKVTQ